MRSGLLPEARHLVLPEGIASSGFPATEATCREIGIYFDQWQTDLNRCILAKTSSGEYAADTVLMSICRQAGKTFDVGGLVFADSIINPGTTTVWTAHRFPVSRESFMALRALASTPKMLAHVDPDEITSAAGNECIPFRNGSRILFKARERGAIRGFTKVRRIVLDEAQILTESAMADMAPTMNHADNPQIILMGTPPKPTDPCDVFMQLRGDALEGSSEGLLYVEFSADDDCDSDDRSAWAQANPSYPRRTSDKAILRLRKLLSEADFRREALGIFDTQDTREAIDLSAWSSLVDMEDVRPKPVAFAVEVSTDRQWTHIGVAGVRADGRRHVQVVTSMRGTSDAARRLAELVEQWSPVAVALDPSGPAGSLLPALSEARVEVETLSAREVAQACGLFIDAVSGFTDGEEREPWVRHPGQAHLDVAVAAATTKPLAGAAVFVPLDRSTDIGPLRAVTEALFVLERETSKKPKRSGAVW